MIPIDPFLHYTRASLCHLVKVLLSLSKDDRKYDGRIVLQETVDREHSEKSEKKEKVKKRFH